MTDRDHDAPMGRLLREAMRGGDHAAPSDCLDPETLAAWVEGSLPVSERSFAEAHAARCSRCQAMLAAMTRTLPASAPAPSAVRKWLIVLGPAAGVAAAVALWFAVEPRTGTFDRGAPVPVAVESAAPVPTQTETRLGGTASADVKPDSNNEVKKDAAAEREASPKPLEDARQDASRRDRPARVRGEPSTTVKEEARTQAEPPVQDREVPQPRAAASPPPPPAPLPQPEAAQQQTIRPPPQQAAPVSGPAQQPGQSQQAADRQAVEGQKAAQAQQEPTPTSDRVTRSAEKAGARPENYSIGSLNETVAMRVADVPTFSVAPRDGSVVWRVLGGRTVQQSVDAGRTWTTQYIADGKTLLLAGAAPSSTVCWLVGRLGAVFVTADGRTWQRAALPATVDLIGVTATDARAAVVTAADKRTYSTADGGHSWTEPRN
jgi:hypothetical protein